MVDPLRWAWSYAEVEAHIPLQHVAFETYEGTGNGISYELGFTPLGRVFRIVTSQSLGRFAPNVELNRRLIGRLAEKYGDPDEETWPLFWGLTENVQDEYGELRPFGVMQASAMLGTDENGLTLEIFFSIFAFCGKTKHP